MPKADALKTDIHEILSGARDVDAVDATMTVRLDDAAVAKVKGSLDDVRVKGEHLGGGAVNSLADLTGPLGDVSQSVNDFGQAFVGAGELAGPALAGIGLDVEALGGTMALGGVALGAIIYFWNTFVGGADAASGKLKEVQEQNGVRRFCRRRQGHHRSAPAVAQNDGRRRRVGGHRHQIHHGQTDVMPLNADAVADATSKQHFLAAELARQRQAWTDNHGDLEAHTRRPMQAVTIKAIGGTTQAFLDQAKNALPEVQKQILAYVAGMTNGIPESRFTEITTDADADNVKQVRGRNKQWRRDRQSTVGVDADTTRDRATKSPAS